ncbi:MAG: AAA family ATPase [Candidatus Dormibacteraceae bacterium]
MLASFRRNPYHFGSPVADGVHFADRERELEKLRSLMLNGQNAVLIAPRRYGKTSLLNRVVVQVRESGGRTGKVSLIRCATPKDVAEELLRGVVHGPLGWLGGHVHEIVGYLRRLRVTPEFTLDPATGEIRGVRLTNVEADVNWREVIDEVIQALGGVGDDRHPASLVLDEFQKMLEISPDLPDVFKGVVDDLPHVSLVFAGSRRHLMERMSNDPDHGALYNVGAKHYLDKVPEPDFIGYLVARAAAAGADLSLAGAERIYAIAAGVPNDVQLVAFFAFEQAEGDTIDGAAIDRALVAAVGDQKDEFEQTFSKLARTQQVLLKCVARGGVASFTSRSVLSELEVTHTAAARAGGVLQEEDLIVRQGPGWTLASGLMREWMRGVAD